MLRKLHVKNFRLLRDVTLTFSDAPIVLLGPNASGKSTVLELLHRLGQLVADRGLDRFHGRNLRYAGSTDPIEIELEFEVPTDESASKPPRQLTYCLVMDSQPGGYARILRESLTLKIKHRRPKLIFQRDDKIHPNSLGLREFRREMPECQAVLDEMETWRVYGNFLTAPEWAFLPFESSQSPRVSQAGRMENRLDGRAENLISTLHNLANNHPNVWEDLQNYFRMAFPFVRTISFPAVSDSGHYSLRWWDQRFPTAKFFADDMSEGMLTYLAMLAITLNPHPTSAAGFDEPENHLHPSLLRLVVGHLDLMAQSTAVIITTHSDRLLDFLGDPVRSVHICESTANGVTIRALDADALSEWLPIYSMSELRHKKILDHSNEEMELET